MSILKVDAIVNENGGTTATINGYTPTVSNMAGRNRIINGDMRIDQRNTGAAVTAAGSYVVDRMRITNITDGAFSAQQDSSAPVGFTNSVKITTTTADATLTTSQSLLLEQRLEGVNTYDLAWGTANAKTVTLSFWVRSSLTGTFGGALQNSAQDRSYPFTYSISVADTWEQKTVTIAGDTTGTWLTTTGIGLRLAFGLGAGPDRSGTAGAWAATNYFSATGATSVVGTNGATWYITGVQLEAGSVATPFEHRQYGQELALCQRYYQKTNSFMGAGSSSGTLLYGSLTFITTMRASPTLTPVGGVLHISDGVAADYNQSSTSLTINSNRVSIHGLSYESNNWSGMTNYRPYFSKQDVSGYFSISAEL